MSRTVCAFEEQVLAAVTSGQWEHAQPDLHAHVETCATCADLALVGALLKRDHVAALDEADIPSSGQVWWRAQVRARAEAQRAAARPLFIAQAVAAAAVLGVLAAIVSWTWPALSSAGGWLFVSARPSELGVVAWLGIGAWLVLAPVAIYFAVARE